MEVKKFDSPKVGKFKIYWDLYINDITDATDFKEIHLKMFECLCDHLVRYDQLQEQIVEEGFTYSNEGRHGSQLKTHPCVSQQKDCMVLIRGSLKDLGLVVKKSGDGRIQEEEETWL